MPQAGEREENHFRDVCFVIMPFGVKEVGQGPTRREVDFDRVYEDLFEPAVSEVQLPKSEGGGKLRPVRTDKEFYASVISQEMFEYIEYSRFALADISAINANVFYELGYRHRAHESGTAIFRQSDAVIPFDINQVKAFPYTVDSEERLEESRELVTQVLTESLERNAWDSPIMLALRQQLKGPEDLQKVLLDAENALRAGEFEKAHHGWLQAAELDPTNPLHDLKASAYPKKKGEWEKVEKLMRRALVKEDALNGEGVNPTYSEAYRELGIAENKLRQKTFARAGEESLNRAVQLAPSDFDAWASLGGVLRRAKDFDGALAAYEKAVKVSRGHPYPLLMFLKLRAKKAGQWITDEETKRWLGEARGFRLGQVSCPSPFDTPWSFFDLAEIQLYLGSPAEALGSLQMGLKESHASWMPGTFLSAMELLPDGADLPGLKNLTAAAQERLEVLQKEEEKQKPA